MGFILSRRTVKKNEVQLGFPPSQPQTFPLGFPSHSPRGDSRMWERNGSFLISTG